MELCAGLARGERVTDERSAVSIVSPKLVSNLVALSSRYRRGRHLFEQEADASYQGTRHLSGSGTFPVGGGMLDVFAIHPHVAFTMIFACIFMAVSWILFLRKFAKTVVWTCEGIKVMALGYMGFKVRKRKRGC